MEPGAGTSGRIERLGKGFVQLTLGLPGRLFALTFVFVLIAEVGIFFPSLGTYMVKQLNERINAAQIASLVFDQQTVDPAAGDKPAQLLAQTGAEAIILNQDSVRMSIFRSERARVPNYSIDLNDTGFWSCIGNAVSTLMAPPGRIILVMGPELASGASIHILLREDILTKELRSYTWNIFLLSLFIAAFTAICVFGIVYLMLVRPMRGIVGSMSRFQERPDDASRIVALRPGQGEINDARFALRNMQTEVFRALQQKSRLAALGTAISKINHDLRNILASAQLVTDRLAENEDPMVRKQAGRLVHSIDRAVALCTQTLKYGKVDESAPALQAVSLPKISEDVRASLDMAEDGSISWVCEMPSDLIVTANPDHLFRVLLNLTRNAHQALQSRDQEGRHDRITVRARTLDHGEDGFDGPVCEILIEDSGPGIPENIRDTLFQAFVTSARAGGTGLGLAISKELVTAQGGTLELHQSGDLGTTFRIVLPLADKEDQN